MVPAVAHPNGVRGACLGAQIAEEAFGVIYGVARNPCVLALADALEVNRINRTNFCAKAAGVAFQKIVLMKPAKLRGNIRGLLGILQCNGLFEHLFRGDMEALQACDISLPDVIEPLAEAWAAAG